VGAHSQFADEDVQGAFQRPALVECAAPQTVAAEAQAHCAGHRSRRDHGRHRQQEAERTG
jgi:hypothetical protein